MVLNVRLQGNRYKLWQRIFQLNFREKNVNHGRKWPNSRLGLPRKAVESPFLETLKTCLYKGLTCLLKIGNHLYLRRWPKVLSYLTCSVILWIWNEDYTLRTQSEKISDDWLVIRPYSTEDKNEEDFAESQDFYHQLSGKKGSWQKCVSSPL